MRIDRINLKDFRNYGELSIAPHSGVNLIFGQNGSGKTNLLEAVHYCALGKSHRTNSDRDVVRADTEMAFAGVSLQKKNNHTDIALRLTPNEARKKQVWVDRKKMARLSDLMGHLQCVIFSPEDLMLIKEGPALRRRFLDMMLSQLSTGYFIALQQYQKALDQRNAMLRERKRGGMIDDDMLLTFEQAMALPCAMIHGEREKAIDKLNEYANRKYFGISGRSEEGFSVSYQSCGKENVTAEYVLDRLKQSRQEDMLRGMTGFGIHREDMIIRMGGREMKLYASQGQIRTAALSMKLAQLQMFKEETGEAPVLLLDDVMSELDMTRRMHLLQETEGVQTFITCTDETDINGIEEMQIYHVSFDTGVTAQAECVQQGKAVKQPIVEDPDFT